MAHEHLQVSPDSRLALSPGLWEPILDVVSGFLIHLKLNLSKMKSHLFPAFFGPLSLPTSLNDTTFYAAQKLKIHFLDFLSPVHHIYQVLSITWAWPYPLLRCRSVLTRVMSSVCISLVVSRGSSPETPLLDTPGEDTTLLCSDLTCLFAPCKISSCHKAFDFHIGDRFPSNPRASSVFFPLLRILFLFIFTHP